MAAWTGWEHDILGALGAPATPSNVRLMDAWQRAEGGSATFNPMNTTQSAPGSSNYNSVGVKNYPNASVGTKATVQTLTNGRYNGIVRDLRAGNVPPARIAAGNASEFGTWGTGAGGILAVLGSGPLPPTSSGGSTRARPGGAPSTPASSGGPLGFLGGVGSSLEQVAAGLFQSISGPVEFYKFIMAIFSPRMWLRALEVAFGSILLLVGLVILAVDTGGDVADSVPRPVRKVAGTAADAALGATVAGRVAKAGGAGRKMQKTTAARGSGKRANESVQRAKKTTQMPRSQLTRREREIERRKGSRAAQAARIRQEGRKQEKSAQARKEQQKAIRDQQELRRFRRESAMANAR